MNKTRRQVSLAAAFLAAATLSGTAMAQAYPAKPITIIVAYPAGGDTDAMARLYAEKLSTRLGQPVLVDNRPGASGTIGSVHVAKASPDGYTLLLAPNTFAIAQFVLKTASGSSYDVLHGFTPIVQTSVQPMFVATNQASGIKDMKTLIAQGKRDGLTYASPGSGSPMHILGEMFNRAAGTRIAHIPYKGVAPAVNDLIGGHVPTTFMTWGPIAPYVGGKVAALAVADSQRSALAQCAHPGRAGRQGCGSVRMAGPVRPQGHVARDREAAEHAPQRDPEDARRGLQDGHLRRAARRRRSREA